MRTEVKHAYALYEKKSGIEEQAWKCIGVSNRRKDMARLASKSAELYYNPILDEDLNLGQMKDELSRGSTDFYIRFTGPSDDKLLTLHYKILRIHIDDINRRTINIKGDK